MNVYTPDPLRDTRHKGARAYRDVASWLDWRELEGKAARTLDGDERYTAALLNSCFDRELSAIGADELNAFLTGVPKASRKKYRSHFVKLFEWAHRTGRIEQNPMAFVATFSKPKQRIVATYSEAEVEALCAGVDGVLYRLLFDTGIRASEARALQVRHVIFERNLLTIFAGKGSKDRLIPMTQRLSQALAEWFLLDGLNPNDYLFACRPGGYELRRSQAIGATSLKTWHRDRQAQAGVVYRNFHATRHSFATLALRRGISLIAVSRMMGHASIKTTGDQYAHLVVEDLAAELALLEAPVTKESSRVGA